MGNQVNLDKKQILSVIENPINNDIKNLIKKYDVDKNGSLEVFF
jgi:hypothetical protein